MGATVSSAQPSKLSLDRKRGRATAKPIVVSGTPAFVSLSRALLARHIGAIAKIYVERAKTEASTPDDFCVRLAAYVVAAPSERTDYLMAARTQLAAQP
jgi:hypothetical protein